MINEPKISPTSAAGPAGPTTSGRRPWLWWLLSGAAVLVVGYTTILRPLTRASGPDRAGYGAGAPLPVTAEPARTADLEVRLVSLGTVTPVSTATVRSRVDGELQKILFQEGQTVAAGAPLAELDPRPFEVQKLQAEAQLAKDNALLENARVDLKRFQTLLAQDSVAEQQVETQDALVRQYEASLKVDQAQVASAALQLTYAHITAPIAGRIGLRNVDLGNIVHATDAGGIAVITQLHPITILFAIPQDSVLKVMKQFATGAEMKVEAFDRDGRTRLATGKLATVDNQIDPTTGTVKLRAEFDNADETLFPNQFVNVQMVVEELKGATVVPTAGVQRGTAGTYVYVVSPEKTVSVRVVETGPSEKGQIVITRGLTPGEVVVVDGVDKLREGSAVELVSRDNGAPAAAKGHGAGNRQPNG
ncbi:MAG: MdtA/MuxA family multidrug efflux RND transporter periplasmic adaptor subunit, partial [Opitutales bacterium]